MNHRQPALSPVFFLLALLPTWVSATDATGALAFFESRIRPVLVEHCYECHSAEASQAKGGLQVDTASALAQGGESGPAIVPGKPEESLLLAAIRHDNADLEMPPKVPKLSASILHDFETWIRQGAADPRQPAKGRAAEKADRSPPSAGHWAYRAPEASPLPKVTQFRWPKRDLDFHILARLEKEGLSPSPDASPLVLIQRLYFDLHGLPPGLDHVRSFVRAWNAADETAREVLLEATVEALLASPRFGERWGRHWLDVARFAESNGRESNLFFPHAWRYRDYVVDAFNADIPFDRFVIEQVAGDLLPASNDEERARLLIATGFLAMGAKGLNEMNPRQFAADLADEQIDTVTRAFTATSVACARCHDHKSEPFTMEDYYALAGIFQSTRTHYGTWVDSENNNGSTLLRLPNLPGQIIPNKPLPPARVQELKKQRAKLDAEEKAQNKYIAQAQKEKRDIGEEGYKLLSNALRIYWTRGGIDGQLMTVDDQGRALPLCMGAGEATKINDAQLLNRGELTQPMQRIPRGYPAAFRTPGPAMPKDHSGRLELAQWLVQREHPLTARVISNRIWHHLFGAGIVRTVDNLGASGDSASHPALLDHLALRMVAGGWSVKSLVKDLVLSRTYRQSSTWREDAYEKDPDNRLLWRAPKRRLDAEAIRDRMLAVSGELDLTRRPGSLAAEQSGQSVSLVGFNEALPADLDGSLRRSLYLPILRDHLPDVLDLFDFAEPSLVTGKRDVTNVPMQALYLMNSAWVRDRAAALARRAASRAPENADLATQMAVASRLCFLRPPDAVQRDLTAQYISKSRAANPDADATSLLTTYCQALLASAEFRHQD